MRGERRFVLLLTCFLLSGLAGLIYQTAWTRQFALVFGTSELAIATVLAAYMGGLAFGARVAGGLAHRVSRPLLTYGLLELGIALSAVLAVPAGIDGVRWLHEAWLGSQAAPPGEGDARVGAFYVVCSFAILLVPTGLMGATLPLLARHAVRTQAEIGSRIGLLYGINTAGAVIGTLLAGFVLLPAVGLAVTVWLAAGLNALVFVAAAGLARGAPLPGPEPGADATALPTGRRRWVLPIMALSGVVSFTYEVLWTRLLGHIMGGSVYAFATMLAAFLAGIALGSGAASRLARNRVASARGLAVAQLGAAALSLLAFSWLDRLPGLVRGMGDSHLLADAVVAGLALLPSTLCIGATFPFAVRILAGDAGSAAGASARVYAWNTCGAILGALGTGFLWLPELGYAGTLTAGVILSLLLAIASAGLAPPAGRRAAALACVGLAAVVFVRPGPPWNLLRTSPLALSQLAGPVAYFSVGRSATVLLAESQGGWQLRTNGLPESRIAPAGSRPVSQPMSRWLTSLPSLARPGARNMLVVGLGGGLVLEEVPAGIEHIDVVELEPDVVAANRAVAARRARDPLTDPRIRIVVNDARGALRLTRERYDAIVSQPSHPWTAGSSHLYTREFFQLVSERLRPDGVLVQWMGLSFVDEPLLRGIVATLGDVFAHVQVYQPVSGGVLFLASAAPLRIEATAGQGLATSPASYAELGLQDATDVLAGLVLDEDGSRAFAAGAALNSDDRNLLQMRSPAVTRSRRGPLDPDALFAPHDPLASDRPELERLRAVRRLLVASLSSRARRVAEASAEPAERALALALVELSAGRAGAGQRRLDEALALDPGSLEARMARLRTWRGALVAGEARAVGLAEGLTGTTGAVVRGWRLAAEGSWDALAELDTMLARVESSAGWYPDAARLRARWRLAARDPQRASEALAIIDALLPYTDAAEDLVLRAEGALAADRAAGALASLFEVLPRVGPGTDRVPLARRALRVIERLPGPQRAAAARERLAARFQRLGR